MVKSGGKLEKRIVLLCTHNGENFILEQLNSIVNQTMKPNQLNIFDFDSNDNTRIIIQRFIEKYDGPIKVKLKLFHYAQGAFCSFLESIKSTLVETEPDSLIFFCDQDDIWEKDKINSQFTLYKGLDFEKNAPVVIYHDVKVVDKDLNLINNDYFRGSPNVLPRDSDFKSLLFGNAIIGHTMMVNVKALKLFQYSINPKKYIMHDWPLALISSLHGHLIFCDKKLTCYRQHDSNVLGVSSKYSNYNFTNTYNYSKRILEQDFVFFLDNKEFIKSSKYRFLFSNYLPIFRFKLAFFGLFFAPGIKKKILSLFILFNWL